MSKTVAREKEEVVAACGPWTAHNVQVASGGDRDRTKRPKMAAAASTLSDVTIATSDNPRTEDPEKIVDDVEVGIVRSGTEYHRVVNRREAIHMALSLATPEDIVVIAGKGHETYQIVGTEKFPFDDREVVREYYRS